MTHETTTPEEGSTATFHGLTADTLTSQMEAAFIPDSAPMPDVAREALKDAIPKIAAGLTDPDLSQRAWAVRTALEVSGALSGNADPEKSETLEIFGNTFFSPEEIRAGLIGVAADVPGEFGELARKDLPVQRERTAEEQEHEGLELFTPEEALVAALMIQGGIWIANLYETSKHLLTPDRQLWAEKTLDGIKDQIIKSGKITDSERLTDIMASAKAKVYARLHKVVTNNIRALREANSELAKI